MKDIILSVVESLDGDTPELSPYLHYILQDFIEIGADPVVMVQLLKEHLHPKLLWIADPGCGKGAISVALAKEFDCLITGIEAMPEFVNSAKYNADEIGVSEKCNFYTGDLRIEMAIADMNEYSDDKAIMMGSMRSRCNELSELYPQHSPILNRYIQNQQGQFARMRNELTGAALLLQSEV